MAERDRRVETLADVIRSALPEAKVKELAAALAPAEKGTSNAEIDADKALRFLHGSFQALGAKVSNLSEVKQAIVKISGSDLRFAMDGFGIAQDLALEEAREQAEQDNHTKK